MPTPFVEDKSELQEVEKEKADASGAPLFYRKQETTDDDVVSQNSDAKHID